MLDWHEPTGHPRPAAGATTPVVANARAAALETRAARLLAEAEMVLHEAQAEAAVVLAAARQEAADIAAAARAKGLAAGHAAGYQEGRQQAGTEAREHIAAAQAEAAAMLAAAGVRVEALEQAALAERAGFLAAAEPQLVRLAVAVAARILQTELVLRPDAVVPMVTAALARLRGTLRPRVRLSPEDLPWSQERRGDLIAALGGGDLDLVADTGLGNGDFLVESDQGTVDGRLGRQITEVCAALCPGDLVPQPGTGGAAGV